MVAEWVVGLGLHLVVVMVSERGRDTWVWQSELWFTLKLKYLHMNQVFTIVIIVFSTHNDFVALTRNPEIQTEEPKTSSEDPDVVTINRRTYVYLN